jgi:hypothetical protein
LSLHPFGDEAIDFFWLLPEQPMRCIDVLGSKVWDASTHLTSELICHNGVAKSPHEQCRALDLGTILNVQQGLVGLEVGFAVAVVVACTLSVYGLASIGGLAM